MCAHQSQRAVGTHGRVGQSAGSVTAYAVPGKEVQAHINALMKQRSSRVRPDPSSHPGIVEGACRGRSRRSSVGENAVAELTDHAED